MRFAARRSVLPLLVACCACAPETARDPPRSIPAEPPQAEVDPWSIAAFDELVVRREGCYGSCPQYEVELRRGGAARWIGMAHTPREGAFTGEVAAQDYVRLCRAAEAASLVRLEASYWTREMHPPRVVVEWVQGDRKGSVRVDGDGGPDDFRAFRALFDEVAATIPWRPVGESRQGE